MVVSSGIGVALKKGMKNKIAILMAILVFAGCNQADFSKAPAAPAVTTSSPGNAPTPTAPTDPGPCQKDVIFYCGVNTKEQWSSNVGGGISSPTGTGTCTVTQSQISGFTILQSDLYTEFDNGGGTAYSNGSPFSGFTPVGSTGSYNFSIDSTCYAGNNYCRIGYFVCGYPTNCTNITGTTAAATKYCQL